MKTVCEGVSHLYRTEDPLNLPQRDLMALMIFELSPENISFFFFFFFFICPSLPSFLLLYKSLILLTSTICPGRLLENSGIYFCLFNNSIYIKNTELCQVGASS